MTYINCTGRGSSVLERVQEAAICSNMELVSKICGTEDQKGEVFSIQKMYVTEVKYAHPLPDTP